MTQDEITLYILDVLEQIDFRIQLLESDTEGRGADRTCENHIDQIRRQMGIVTRKMEIEQEEAAFRKKWESMTESERRKYMKDLTDPNTFGARRKLIEKEMEAQK